MLNFAIAIGVVLLKEREAGRNLDVTRRPHDLFAIAKLVRISLRPAQRSGAASICFSLR
jgi:hypothetical protein